MRKQHEELMRESCGWQLIWNCGNLNAHACLHITSGDANRKPCCMPSKHSSAYFAGGGGSGGHSVLASAMEPATLAHTYNTDRGTFKPAPQPPRKAPTALKNPKLPDFALLPDEEAEAEVAHSLSQHGYSLLEGEQGAQGMMSDEEVGTLLQEWFKEQKHFQENVTLRRQHVLLSRQIALLQKHLAAAGSAAEAPAASATGAVSIKGKLQRRKQIAK